MRKEFTIGPDDFEVSLSYKYADRHQRSRYTDLNVSISLNGEIGFKDGWD